MTGRHHCTRTQRNGAKTCLKGSSCKVCAEKMKAETITAGNGRQSERDASRSALPTGKRTIGGGEEMSSGRVWLRGLLWLDTDGGGQYQYQYQYTRLSLK